MAKSDPPLSERARVHILDTESKLRNIVSKTLSRLHGSNWENKPGLVFSSTEIQDMEKRRIEEYKILKRPMSSRLIDYSYIVDLKQIINTNWPEFASVFSSKNTTMAFIQEYHNGLFRYTEQLSEAYNACSFAT